MKLDTKRHLRGTSGCLSLLQLEDLIVITAKVRGWTTLRKAVDGAVMRLSRIICLVAYVSSAFPARLLFRAALCGLVDSAYPCSNSQHLIWVQTLICTHLFYLRIFYSDMAKSLNVVQYYVTKSISWFCIVNDFTKLVFAR